QRRHQHSGPRTADSAPPAHQQAEQAHSQHLGDQHHHQHLADRVIQANKHRRLQESKQNLNRGTSTPPRVAMRQRPPLRNSNLTPQARPDSSTRSASRAPTLSSLVGSTPTRTRLSSLEMIGASAWLAP